MRVKLKAGPEPRRFIERIEELSGENVYACYQCGRCSPAAPSPRRWTYCPTRSSAWSRWGSTTRSAAPKRCSSAPPVSPVSRAGPKGIDMAHVMEAVRHVLDPKGADAFGPNEISPELAKELPQQVMVAVFRKFSK